MNELLMNFEENKTKIKELKKYTSQKSILFAEDYEVLHKSIKRILNSLFKVVDGAYNGEEALHLYKENSYDFVLSDISMPKMSGIELSKQIKTSNPSQEIIILSAHRDADFLHELLNIGVRRFIEKPISLGSFVDEFYIICKNLYSEKDMKNSVVVNANTVYKVAQQDLYVDEKLIKLTEYEKKLLYIFIERRNQTVSIDEVANYFYRDGIDINIENIRKYIYKLRKKLPKKLIKNLHGVGYTIESDT
ncbi:MAG: response regulator [Campylobacterota bacterium]|nr:response regulator [Campylobacterota bacterium]